MQILLKRYCKTMELRNDPALIEAYKKAHGKGAVWPEITQGMKEVGLSIWKSTFLEQNFS